ncbi:MAG TPA: class I SAM-dependent methyltransferase [Anaerolineales bacterium]|nr:class I SAM-dependent methyltransferase [Anaerolineales bacterium]HNQ94581.1 class I SAM-dependent methyltransferase [Anaerolineales bacterium]HNS62020.1 class I SAM-dependent methyltransferase [Anaerolineales bacterium]
MNDISNTLFATVAEAYNRNADKYDEFIENNPNLQRMRRKVYAHATALLPQGVRILDLACGTGTDAFWFAQHGYTVHGVDISDGMLQRAAEKARQLGLQNKAVFEHLSYTELGKLGKTQFDCVFSNFGGLNCVADLKLVADEVRPLLTPNAKIIWALMPPFCLWESAMLLRGRFKLATRRFRGQSTVYKEGLHYPVYYYTPKQVAQAWGAGFQIESIRALSVITPPATNKDFALKRPRVFDLLGKLDDLAESKFPFKYWGDFTITTLKQNGSPVINGKEP